MLIDRIKELSKKATEDDLAEAEFLAQRLKRMDQEIARRFGISLETYRMIMNGEVKVDHITYTARPRRQWKAVAGQTGIAAMAVLLVLLLSVPGMADSIRASVLRVFTSHEAVRVESVAYDRYADLQGYVVPSLMPSGYASNYHTTTGDMLYMSYVNGAGEQIQYYCYPRGASASYDNEHAAHHVIESKRGTIHVWNAESGHTTAYLLVGEAYVQMDFDTSVTDREIQQIVDGLNRVS